MDGVGARDDGAVAAAAVATDNPVCLVDDGDADVGARSGITASAWTCTAATGGPGDALAATWEADGSDAALSTRTGAADRGPAALDAAGTAECCGAANWDTAFTCVSSSYSACVAGPTPNATAPAGAVAGMGDPAADGTKEQPTTPCTGCAGSDAWADGGGGVDGARTTSSSSSCVSSTGGKHSDTSGGRRSGDT